MNIQDLKSNTTWQEASNTINNNNNKISLAIATLENATLKNKGYFTTLEKLNEAIPNPTIGSKAYVGTSEPYAIYIVENGVWVDSGYTGGDEIVAKITTDRIEDGAVTSEKIATSAFDSTLSVSGKIAPADVVGDKFTELDWEINGKKNIVNESINPTPSTPVYKIPSTYKTGEYVFEKGKEISLFIESEGVLDKGFTPYVRTGDTLEPMCQVGQGEPNKIIKYTPTIDAEYIQLYIKHENILKEGSVNVSAIQQISDSIIENINKIKEDIDAANENVKILDEEVKTLDVVVDDIDSTINGADAKVIDITSSIGEPTNGFWYQKNIGTTFTGALDATSDGLHHERVDVTNYTSVKIEVEHGNGNRAVILCDENNKVIDSQKWGDHTDDKTITIDATNGKWLYISTNTLPLRGQLKVTATKKPSKGLVGEIEILKDSSAYVAPNGNDNNDGSADAPFATINKAIENGSSRIFLADGVYSQKINLQKAKGKDIKIMPAATGITPIIKSPNRLVINDGSETLVSGKTKTYKKVLSATLSASLKWIYQEGVTDVTTRVDDAEVHPLQRGLTYRCENTCIILATSNTINDAIAEIDAYDGYKWYFDGSTKTLYFSRPQPTSSQTPLVIPNALDKIFDNIHQGIKVDMSGISIWYMKGNFYNMFQPNVFDCSVKYVNGDGFSWDNTIGATFNHCEACRCQFYNNGDGFNAHATYTSSVNPYAKYTTATLIDCWAHDIYDDGYSDHERCEVQIHGGLFEYCGKGGLTPANGTHCICYNVLSRRNYRGFYMAGVVAEEGGNGGQMLCYGCVAESNYIPSSNNNTHSLITGTEGSGFHVSGNINKMILIDCISISNEIGYRTDTSAIAKLVNCSSKDDTTKKVLGDTSVIDNTELVV